jgi:hypothetical protein
VRESLEYAQASPARPSNKNIIKSKNFPDGFSFLIHAANLTQNTQTHYLISHVKLTNVYGVNMCERDVQILKMNFWMGMEILFPTLFVIIRHQISSLLNVLPLIFACYESRHRQGI